MKLAIEDSRLNHLVQFGLTYLQAKVYVSTYLLYEATVKEIMDVCQMHKAEVYRVLRELEEMKAVDRIVSHPVRYRSRQPEEVLKNLLVRHVERIALLGDLKEEILGWFSSLKYIESAEQRHDDGFEILRGAFVLKRINEMINRAEDEILYISRAYEDILKSEIPATFYRAIDRGVKARGIYNITKQDIDTLKTLKKSPLVLRRHSDEAYSWIVIVDRKEMVFGSAPRALPDEDFLYTRNRRFIRHYIRAFDLLFKDSIPIEDRIRELQEEPKAVDMFQISQEKEAEVEKTL